jgi:hypothetical protein
MTATSPKDPSWMPVPDYGTWHPQGKGLGPVTYVQRLRGQSTGLYFKVPRWRYWWISALVKMRDTVLVSHWARRRYERLQVTYHYLPTQTQLAPH